MKRLSTIMICLFAMTMASLSAKAQEITIYLMPGWNWISYTNAVSMDIDEALGDFVPMEGDIVKSKYAQATCRSGSWRGTLHQFTPGLGYHYYSNRGEPVSFVFASTAPQLTVTTVEPTEITATSAMSGGSITSNDGSYIYVLQKGICWATHPNPMVMNDFFTENGSGAESFTAEMTDLNPNTEYYVRAYAVTINGTVYGDELVFITFPPEGAINGQFTINADGDQVFFSQGNLQYQASTNTWRFAESQWDYVGGTNIYGNEFGTVYENGVKCDNCLISQTYSGWIDLFGWGTSGWNNGNTYYQPWSLATWNESNNGALYGPPGNYNLTGVYSNADWGSYNSISNGGNQPNQWRTLTIAEWNYVLNTRSTISGIHYAKAQVNNVNGIILLPDDWSIDTYNLINTNSGSASYNSNTLTASQWSDLEQAGAVFLPAAGTRDGNWLLTGMDNSGFYWSSSFSTLGSNYAYDVYFNDSHLYSLYDHGRCEGQSVRLVYLVE